MTKLRKTLFISDLHLQADCPQITEKFLHLLATADDSIDAIYILGDLFEVWIGDDNATPFHQHIMEALLATSKRGIHLYFMKGNRDFLIGKQFSAATGCELLPDEKIISLYHSPVLLMHGDTLCTRDEKYLKARKLGRNPFIQFLFLSLPLKLRRWIADRMRHKSMKHTQSTNKDIMDVTDAAVIAVMEKHKTQYLIHGHTHRPNAHPLIANGKNGTRIVLGAWHEQAYVLCWDEQGKQEVSIF